MWTWETLPGWSFYILVGFWFLLGGFFWHSLKPMYWWRWLEDSSLNFAPTFHTSKSSILKMTICRWKMWLEILQIHFPGGTWPNSVSAYRPSGLQASHLTLQKGGSPIFCTSRSFNAKSAFSSCPGGPMFVPSRPSLSCSNGLVSWLAGYLAHSNMVEERRCRSHTMQSMKVNFGFRIQIPDTEFKDLF